MTAEDLIEAMSETFCISGGNKDADDIDEFVRAELPSEDERPQRQDFASNQDYEDLNEKMTMLLESAWNTDADLEIAIRQWAFTNATVRQHVERIDQIRLGYISAIYSQLVNDPKRGPKLGKIAYYGLLGALHAWPRFTKNRLRDTILEIQEILTE